MRTRVIDAPKYISKDWENIFKAEPRQVYLNITSPGDYEQVEVHVRDGEGIKIVEVPPAIPCLIINIGKDEAWVINMPNPAWHPQCPDDNSISYDDYVCP